MRYELVVADPARNITIFVITPVENRVAVARALLAEPSLGAEQVGFVVQRGDGADDASVASVPRRPYWRLEMMGGEFCGNAARSFGLFVARRTGLTGKTTVMIEISGTREALPVRVDVEMGRAEVEIPKPLAMDTLLCEGRRLPVCVFEGITHVIAPGVTPDRETFSSIKEVVEKRGVGDPSDTGHQDAGHPADADGGGAWHPDVCRPADGDHPSDACRPMDGLGVMFYDEAARLMVPAVYVYGTDSLVFESSCGSGSAALAVWLSRELRDGEERYKVAQPGGTIEVHVGKRGGEITGISIGGPVGLRDVSLDLDIV
jgi:diaminopimelate epimerase